MDRDDEPGQRRRSVRLQAPELDRVDLRLTHNQPGSRARTARSQQRWCDQWAVILLRSRGISPHRSDPGRQHLADSRLQQLRIEPLIGNPGSQDSILDGWSVDNLGRLRRPGPSGRRMHLRHTWNLSINPRRASACRRTRPGQRRSTRHRFRRAWPSSRRPPDTYPSATRAPLRSPVSCASAGVLPSARVRKSTSVDSSSPSRAARKCRTCRAQSRHTEGNGPAFPPSLLRHAADSRRSKRQAGTARAGPLHTHDHPQHVRGGVAGHRPADSRDR